MPTKRPIPVASVGFGIHGRAHREVTTHSSSGSRANDAVAVAIRVEIAEGRPELHGGRDVLRQELEYLSHIHLFEAAAAAAAAAAGLLVVVTSKVAPLDQIDEADDLLVHHLLLPRLAHARVAGEEIGFQSVVVGVVDGREDRVAVGVEAVALVPVGAPEAGADAPDAPELVGRGAYYPAIFDQKSMK